MTKKAFITIKIPVECEKLAKDCWLATAYLNVTTADDRRTPAAAIKSLRQKITEQVRVMKGLRTK